MWQYSLTGGAVETANEGSGANRTYLPEALAVRGYDDSMGTV